MLIWEFSGVEADADDVHLQNGLLERMCRVMRAAKQVGMVPSSVWCPPQYILSQMNTMPRSNNESGVFI